MQQKNVLTSVIHFLLRNENWKYSWTSTQWSKKWPLWKGAFRGVGLKSLDLVWSVRKAEIELQIEDTLRFFGGLFFGLSLDCVEKRGNWTSNWTYSSFLRRFVFWFEKFGLSLHCVEISGNWTSNWIHSSFLRRFDCKNFKFQLQSYLR